MTTIRDFRESDGDSVRTMMKTLAVQRKESDHNLVLKDEYSRFFANYMLGFLKNPDAIVKVAEDEGKVVGYAVATRGREANFYKYSQVAVLSDVFVTQSHRGKGVAYELLEAIEAWGRRNKLQGLVVNVFPEHKEELGALRKLGFFEYRVKMLRPFDEKGAGKSSRKG